MKFPFKRKKLLYLLGWLPAVVVLVVAYYRIPPILSSWQSQAELMAGVQQMLAAPVKEISLVPGANGRDAGSCYVTQSQNEISRIVGALRDVRKQMSQGTSRLEPFVLTLTFLDDSRAYFMLYRRVDDLSRAHLDRLEHAPNRNSEPRLVGDAGLEFREIGAWAAEEISRNHCR